MNCASGEVNWPCCRIRFRGDVRFLQQGFDRIVNFAQSAHPFWKGNHHDMQRDMATLLRWCPRTLPIAMPSHMLKWLIFNRLWNSFVQEPPQHNLPKTSGAIHRQPHCRLRFAIACRSSASPRNSFKNVGALMASPLSRASSLAGTESCMPLVNQNSKKVHCVVNRNPFVKEPPLCGRLNTAHITYIPCNAYVALHILRMLHILSIVLRILQILHTLHILTCCAYCIYCEYCTY